MTDCKKDREGAMLMGVFHHLVMTPPTATENNWKHTRLVLDMAVYINEHCQSIMDDIKLKVLRGE